MNKIKLMLLILIVALAFIARFYKVAQVPESLYWDEVAIGYNAYSILETGKDEYGVTLPFLFRSFDDYKLPGQVYLTVPSIALFGKNELAVRFPAVLIATLTVLATYFFVLRLLSGHRMRTKMALLASLFVATSPWHLQFTRAAFEAGSALLFIIVGTTVFLQAVAKKKMVLFCFSGCVLALSCYFYRSPVAFIPLLIIVLLVVNFRKLTQKGIAAFLIVFLLFYTPVAYTTTFGVGATRLNQVGVASETFDETVENARLIEQSGNTPLAKIIYNRRLVYAVQFIKNYIDSFDINFFFFQGDANGRHRTLGMGTLYYWEIGTLLLGLVALYSKAKRILAFIVVWFLTSLVPAALSTPVPHMLRTLNMIPIPQILSAAGIVFFTSLAKRFKLYLPSIFFISVVVSLFWARYLYQYYIVTGDYAAFFWGDPYKELALTLEEKAVNVDRVVITGSNWQPYIYLLFYQKINPNDFQRNGNNFQYGKYWFGSPDWDPSNAGRQLRNINLADFTRDTKNVLFVLSPDEYTHHEGQINKLSELKSEDGRVVFILARLRE